MDAGAAVSHTGKASGTVFDVFVDHMDDMVLLACRFVHSVQKDAGDVHGVALLPLGASVQYKNLHLISASFWFTSFSFSRYTSAEQEKLTAAAKQTTPGI